MLIENLINHTKKRSTSGVDATIAVAKIKTIVISVYIFQKGWKLKEF